MTAPHAQSLGQQAKSKAEDTAQAVTNKFSDLGQMVADKAGELKDDLSEGWDEAKSSVQNFDLKQVNRRILDTVGEHPWAALGVTFLVGALAGYRLGKR